MAANARTRAGRLQRLSQVRQIDVERVNSSRRGFVTPEHLNKSIRSHDSIGVQHQCDEQGALLVPTQLHGPAGARHLE